MEKILSKKYIGFPIIMLLITIKSAIYVYDGQSFTKTNIQIIEKLDFTGMTKIFLIAMVIFEVLMLGICLFKGIQGNKVGYDYSFNKIILIVFIIYTILPIVFFTIIRNEEEKQALKTNQEYEEYLSEINNNLFKSISKNKKIDDSTSKIQELKNDKYYNRKKAIISEIENEKSTFVRYIKLFYYRFEYNENDDTFYMTPYDTETYYGIFSIFSVINLVCLIFYFWSTSDESLNEKTQIIN